MSTHLRTVSILVACMVAMASTGCASPTHPHLRSSTQTCLVLSVGAHHGIAHLGAIEALRERGVHFDCVVGNSMGSLIGALHASDPDAPMPARYSAFAATYEAATRREVGENGGLGLLLGFMFLGPVGAIAGGVGAASATDPVNHRRMIASIKAFFANARIEQLRIPFATLHQAVTSTGMTVVEQRTGLVAEAVGQSIANPLIFSDVRLREGVRLDPGADRVSAVPVYDACRMFPGATLIAINVTSHPTFVERGSTCEIHEIAIDASSISMEAARGHGPEFDAAVQLGRDAVQRAGW